VSYLPVQQDGSCNGLQHYAALGRDKAGAAAVNLMDCEAPQVGSGELLPWWHMCSLAEGAEALVWPFRPRARVWRRTIEPLCLQPEKHMWGTGCGALRAELLVKLLECKAPRVSCCGARCCMAAHVQLCSAVCCCVLLCAARQCWMDGRCYMCLLRSFPSYPAHAHAHAHAAPAPCRTCTLRWPPR
jgi:hypothetical protein